MNIIEEFLYQTNGDLEDLAREQELQELQEQEEFLSYEEKWKDWSVKDLLELESQDEF